MSLAGDRERLHSAAIFADVFHELDIKKMFSLAEAAREEAISKALDLENLPTLRSAAGMVVIAQEIERDRRIERTPEEWALLAAMKKTVITFVENKLAGGGTSKTKKTD